MMTMVDRLSTDNSEKLRSPRRGKQARERIRQLADVKRMVTLMSGAQPNMRRDLQREACRSIDRLIADIQQDGG